MSHAMPNKKSEARNAMLVVRVSDEQKALIAEAAEREGLQLSSFIIMLLVRSGVLPDGSPKTLKRRPVPSFNALHGLLGVVNNIGGNCKQLDVAFPNMEALHHAHAEVIAAAAAITDALHGKKISPELNLYRLQDEVTKTGHVFNQIVKSVNIGRPNLIGLPSALQAIVQSAASITVALNGSRPIEDKKYLFRSVSTEICKWQKPSQTTSKIGKR